MIPFAVKRFERIFEDIQRGTRLLREITILSKISHTCLNKLVTIFPPADYSELNDTYMVLDKCDMDLKKLLRSNKYLQEIQCKSIIYDILCGLKYLHNAKICHWDLKPENILVNDDCTIQICDFGLSRSLEDIPDPSMINTNEKIENNLEVEENKTNVEGSNLSPNSYRKIGKDDRPSLNINKSNTQIKQV